MTEPDPRITNMLVLGEDAALAMLLQHLSDRIEADPVTSWTADSIYAGLTRLAAVAEHKRRAVEVVRDGRPPSRPR